MPGLYRINKAFLIMLSKLGYQFYDQKMGQGYVIDIRTNQPASKNTC